ncbi:hypothetical protein GmHk_05G013444 [Glycine max]|nr:hypothetical protein GmHk_05G013444 [Glycine max]
MACSLWPMFVDYVCQTWVIPHKEKFVKAWTNKVMHLENTTTNSVWEAMNNMITLQHTQIKASFETSTYMVEHVFKVTLYKKLLGMASMYALNEIAAEYECVSYAGKNPSRCGCVMRSTHDQGLCKAQVTITEEMETISKRFEKLDVCGKVHLKTKLREIAYPDLNSMCAPPEKVKTTGAPKKTSRKCDPSYWEYVDALNSVQNSNSLVKRSASSSEEPIQRQNIPMLDQFHQCIHDSIENIIDIKADGNYSYRAIAALLDNINLFGGIERFEELKRSLLVDRLSMVTMDKWMNIMDMRYVIASRYNATVVSLSRQQSLTFFKLVATRFFCASHFFTRPLSFTTIGVVVEYTLSLSDKAVVHPVHRLKTEFVDLGEQ